MVDDERGRGVEPTNGWNTYRAADSAELGSVLGDYLREPPAGGASGTPSPSTDAVPPHAGAVGEPSLASAASPPAATTATDPGRDDAVRRRELLQRVADGAGALAHRRRVSAEARRDRKRPARTPRPTRPTSGTTKPQAPTGLRRVQTLLAVVLGVAAAVAGFLAPAQYVLAAIPAIVLSLLLRFSGGMRAFSAVIVLVLIGLAGLLFGGPIHGMLEPRTTPPSGSSAITGSQTVAGSGNATIEFTYPDGANTPAIVRIDTAATDWSVRLRNLTDDGHTSVVADYDDTDTGVVLARESTGGALSVEANGSWVITIESPSTLPRIDGTVTGNAPRHFYYDGPGGAVTVTSNGNSHVSVRGQGDAGTWSFSNSKFVSATWIIDEGPTIIQVNTTQPWTLHIDETFETVPYGSPLPNQSSPGSTLPPDEPSPASQPTT